MERCHCPFCRVNSTCKPKTLRSPFQTPFKCVTPMDIKKSTKQCYCCSWVLQFVTWVQDSFPRAIVEHISVVEGGGSSVNLGMHFNTKLLRYRVNLTHNDLFILDYC